MNPLDILKTFDRDVGKFAFIATYDFDPEFFEGRFLKTKGFGSASTILILMDSRRYAELLNRGIEGTSFNRRYLVLPVSPSHGVFHPKLYLVLGKKTATAMVGSANCTSAGVAYNMELCSTFFVDNEQELPLKTDNAAIVRHIYRAIRGYSNATKMAKRVLEEHFFNPVEEVFPWLDLNVLEIATPSKVALLNSMDSPLLEQVRTRLIGRDVSKVSIISPFYDKDLRTLERISRYWPSAKMDVVAQPKYSQLSSEKLAAMFSTDLNGRLLAASPPPGRRLHAKAFAFETEIGTFWLAGSANATDYGLGGNNIETGVWFVTADGFDHLFDEEDLKLTEIDPKDFVPGDIDEPGVGDEKQSTNLITLFSAMLFEDGQVQVDTKDSKGVSDLVLSIRNVGQEGQSVESNRVALAQLNRMFREGEAGRSHGNPLKRIAETGEGLNSFVDSLDGTRDVIEFFRNTNIRFFDNEDKRRTTAGKNFKPRDPFVSDSPNGWEGISIEGDLGELREAIREFVKRHQKEKLSKHVKRGNLNGLPNFLDVFRTTNSILLTWHSRRSSDGHPIVPDGHVTPLILRNIEFLIGAMPGRADGEQGFIDAIRVNLQSEGDLVLELLGQLSVAPMLRAAVEALVDVREKALGLDGRDRWALAKLRWVSDWIEKNGLKAPTEDAVDTALREYRPLTLMTG